MTTRQAWAVGLLLCLGCDAEELHTATLVLSEIKRGDKSALSGFACTTSDSRFAARGSTVLLARAYTESPVSAKVAVVKATMVIDYVALGGYPRCRATEIVNYCAEEGKSCEPIARQRQCLDLDPLEIPVKDLAALVSLYQRSSAVFADYAKTRLSGELVTRDAPDVESIVRLVGTTETCNELEARGGLDFDPEKLIGCSYSCPLVPSAVRGEILLDFESVGACEDDVIACAGTSFAPRSQREIPGIGQSASP